MLAQEYFKSILIEWVSGCFVESVDVSPSFLEVHLSKLFTDTIAMVLTVSTFAAHAATIGELHVTQTPLSRICGI